MKKLPNNWKWPDQDTRINILIVIVSFALLVNIMVNKPGIRDCFMLGPGISYNACP